MPVNSALIETHALAALTSNDLRVIETDRTREAFDAGHIPGSVFWPLSELFTPDFRLRTDPVRFERLLERSGISSDTLVVCTFGGEAMMAGWAPWLFWILTGFGHTKTVVLDGGTPKWRAEGRPLTSLEPEIERAFSSRLPNFSETERANWSDVRQAVQGAKLNSCAPLLLDARSDAEFRGAHFFDAPPQAGERAGHIPSALHLPHSALLHADGTFKTAEELRAVTQKLGLHADREIITYCAVGIRSALLWFALKHLLGFPQVRNYDGSWNEWSRLESDISKSDAGESDAGESDIQEIR